MKTLPIFYYCDTNPICIAITILFALNSTKNWIQEFFLFFNYLCLHHLPLQLDLNVVWKILSIISKYVVRNFFFSSQSLKICDNIASNNLEMNFILFTIYHNKCINQLILLLSGDISLNPGPPHNSQNDRLSWNVFDKKGLHFLHINVNSILPKIEKVRFVAKKSKAIVSGITEIKLDGTIFDAELYIEDYSIVRCDRDRKGGGVTCYIKNDICFSTKNVLSKKIAFVDLLLPKTKPISVGIVYRPPKDTIFFTIICRNSKFFRHITEWDIHSRWHERWYSFSVISCKMVSIC